MIGFTPLGRQVLLVREAETQTGPLVVIQKEGLACWYRVRATGPEVRDTRPGQRVLANSMAGLDLELDEACVLMSETGILAYD